jgi:YfiR/HmsC-like
MSKNISYIKKASVFFAFFCFLIKIISAQTNEREADLKAVFIYNFTKYISWDTTVNDNNFVIGVMGNSPVTESLKQIANGYTVGNKKIIIRNFSKPEDISYCQILFIPRNLPFSLESILKKVGRGMLTVSEEPGYGKSGTAFNFFISKEDKLKFEANLKVIYAEGLKASSQLLKLATIVD